MSCRRCKSTMNKTKNIPLCWGGTYDYGVDDSFFEEYGYQKNGCVNECRICTNCDSYDDGHEYGQTDR